MFELLAIIMFYKLVQPDSSNYIHRVITPDEAVAFMRGHITSVEQRDEARKLIRHQPKYQ